MKTIGKVGFQFPESPQDAREWQPTMVWVALHRNVLVVARTRIEGAWAAYCFPVPGENHDRESELWRTEGAKMHEKYARALFPRFDGIPYAA